VRLNCTTAQFQVREVSGAGEPSQIVSMFYSQEHPCELFKE
jgi:hypothetical protein